MGEELVAGLVDLVQVLGAGLVVVTVANQAVLGDPELGAAGLVGDVDVAAGAADRALPRELDAVPVLIAGVHERAVAVGANAVLGVAEPAALLDRGLDGADDVLAHLAGTAELVAPLDVRAPHERIARTAVALGHVAVHDLHGHGKHRGLQALERERLPVVHGAADADEACDGVRVLLDGADGEEERELVGEEALGQAGVDRARGEVIGRDGEDDALAGLDLGDDGVHVVLLLEDAAVVLLLQAGAHLAHLHGAALAAGAGQDVVVEEVDELDLAAGLLDGAERLLGEHLAVAPMPTCANSHNLKRHDCSSPEAFSGTGPRPRILGRYYGAGFSGSPSARTSNGEIGAKQSCGRPKRAQGGRRRTPGARSLASKRESPSRLPAWRAGFARGFSLGISMRQAGGPGIVHPTRVRRDLAAEGWL